MIWLEDTPPGTMWKNLHSMLAARDWHCKAWCQMQGGEVQLMRSACPEVQEHYDFREKTSSACLHASLHQAAHSDVAWFSTIALRAAQQVALQAAKGVVMHVARRVSWHAAPRVET